MAFASCDNGNQLEGSREEPDKSGQSSIRLPESSEAKAIAKPSTDTSLSHVITSERSREWVSGVTVCDEKVFVLRRWNEGRIETYDVETFNELTSVRVNDLTDGYSLTSCNANRCLYVTGSGDSVYRVDLSKNNVISWRVRGGAWGLSVNRANNVLVTCFSSNVIKEYSSRGSLVRSIKLHKKSLFGSTRPSLVTAPWHTVQLTDSQYVVCHWGPEQGVSLINERGKLLASYGNSETSKLVNEPQCSVVVSDSILIADRGNNRILSLNFALSEARELFVPVNTQLTRPCCMHMDRTRGRLYVGEWGGEYRVLVFDNLNFER